MNSCVYEGRVRHRRLAPQAHAFTYRVFMMALDLDELDSVFAGRWLWSTAGPNLAWFREQDHAIAPGRSLKETILDLVDERLGFRPTGSVRLLTHLRYFGYVMNPVSFYYVSNADDEVEAIVAEVHNTPWGERHCYVFDARGERAGSRRFRFPKVFHVSPFMPMHQEYDWRFGPPGERLMVHMINLEAGARIFDATLSLRARPVTSLNLARVLLRYPCMTIRVVTAIYWQALRLRLKRTPFHPHPRQVARPS